MTNLIEHWLLCMDQISAVIGQLQFLKFVLKCLNILNMLIYFS